ncbi:unnamed protein product [Lymnaea stagnalis]|uniref:Uncharacterized protein n=1 Tax=Lymnaea stagnalis TaxID=6523 RepID=A0AAV2I172_LYMST
MARNEEKQLARLNRFYLHQQKEEELKKRPPRPRLDSLNTVNEVKKWLPSIMRDIEFYVTQMEVSCYPKRQIEEFERRIDNLRGEYKAFVRKIRQLEPESELTPWSDKPYVGKQRKLELKSFQEDCDPVESSANEPAPSFNLNQQNNPMTFMPIATPVLISDHVYKSCYGYEAKKSPDTTSISLVVQDKPLDFDFSKRVFRDGELELKEAEYSKESSSEERIHDGVTDLDKKQPQENGRHKLSDATDPGSLVTKKQQSFTGVEVRGSLNIPYADSSSEEDGVT